MRKTGWLKRKAVKKKRERIVVNIGRVNINDRATDREIEERNRTSIISVGIEINGTARNRQLFKVCGWNWPGPRDRVAAAGLNGARDEYGIPDELARLQKAVCLSIATARC